MNELFACNPDCSFAKLSALDYLVIAFTFVIVFLVTMLLKKWFFSLNKYPENSIKWHIPRLLFFILVISLVTCPLIYSFFGSTAALIYSKTILPELCIVIYGCWYILKKN